MLQHLLVPAYFTFSEALLSLCNILLPYLRPLFVVTIHFLYHSRCSGLINSSNIKVLFLLEGQLVMDEVRMSVGQPPAPPTTLPSSLSGRLSGGLLRLL